MGERKGTNLYYPPDYDPKKGGINKFLGTHPLRERARKLGQGILIIRFEMPFNIWCNGCGNHIGMGVRYNAEKKKIGYYYTTPIWSFRMKCHLCDNHFEIKTEPKTCEYIIESGARRQENRWDPTQNDQVVPEDKETQKRLFDDAMFKLEHGHGDQKQAQVAQPALAKLTEKRDRLWQDDYAANSALRQQFRAKTKELKVKGIRNSISLQYSSNETDEERAAKKRKVLLDLYEGHKSRHLKELAETNPLRSTILNSVKRKSDGNSMDSKDESNMECSTATSSCVKNAATDVSTTSSSLVSGVYDSSSSDENT